MPLELKITMSEAGEIRVDGCVDQKIAAYGMLEVARQLISAYEPTKIIAPSSVDVNKINGLHKEEN